MNENQHDANVTVLKAQAAVNDAAISLANARTALHDAEKALASAIRRDPRSWYTTPSVKV